MKKVLSLFLALLMVVGAFTLVACKKTPETPNRTTEPTTGSNEPTADPDDQFDVPTMNIGRKMKVLTFNGVVTDFLTADEKNSEKEMEDNVSKAIVLRDYYTMEHLGIELQVDKIEGQWGAMNEFIQTVSNNVFQGGDPYDIIAAYSLIPVALMIRGAMENLNEVPHVDFDKNWWSDFVYEAVTLNDQTYFMTGELSASLLYNMQVILYNRSLLAAQSTVTDAQLYEMVDNNEWTIDRFFEVAASVSLDNADGVEDKNKKYVIGLSDNNQLDSFYVASGMHLFQIEDGKLEVSANVKSEKVMSLFETVMKAVNDGQTLRINGTPSNFKNGLEVFTIACVKYVKTDFNDMKQIGLLPFPKYDAQDSYHTLLGSEHAQFFVPTNVASKEESGALLETLAYAGSVEITPAVYETIMKKQYSKDPDSSRMFDIIRAGTTTELGILSYPLFSGGLEPASMFRNGVIGGKDKSGWTSYVTGFESGMTEVIGILNAYFGTDGD